MKTPINSPSTETKALPTLLKKIPKGSVIDSHLFFSGQLELSLTEYERFVCARTTQYVIFEFWNCLMLDPKRIYNIAVNEKFKFNESDFDYLQENWPKQHGEYIRSALFFTLNRCSDTGFISSGNLSLDNFNRVSLAALNSFRPPKNFHLVHDADLYESLQKNTEATHTVVNIGKYDYNLFDTGKSFGYEETIVNHSKVKNILFETNKKMALIYKNDKRLLEHFKNTNYDLTFINKYGTICSSTNASEVIIANF